jgi:membrane associated rhomboid family serine protease
MDRVREQELAHRNLERGGILLAIGLAGMIAGFLFASRSGNDRILFGALAGWLLAVLGAIWLVDGFRHRYAARRTLNA